MSNSLIIASVPESIYLLTFLLLKVVLFFLLGVVIRLLVLPTELVVFLPLLAYEFNFDKDGIFLIPLLLLVVLPMVPLLFTACILVKGLDLLSSGVI